MLAKSVKISLGYVVFIIQTNIAFQFRLIRGQLDVFLNSSGLFKVNLYRSN